MSKKYTLTLYIAAPGTPLTDDKGQPLIKNGKQEHSMVGHVYYKISDGTKDGTTGYGFAPKKDGDPFGPGEVQRKEYEKYQNPIYERQLEISEEQYRRLSDYGAKHETLRQFNTATYNGLNNSCVDFTFVALKYAGIYQGRKASVYDDLGNEISYTDRSHEGTVKVVPNIREFEKIPAPFPNSPLNKTIHRDMPERTWLQKRLTEREQEQHYQYAQAAPAFNLDSLPKPFQNLYPKIQEHLTAYHEKYGIPIDDAQKHNAAVALSALAYSETMGKRQDVPLLFNIKDGQYLIGERNPGLIKTSMEMEQALSLPVEHSLNRVQEITRQFEQQELERQMARQQSRGMTMG